ncbi:hypothetical protein HSB1_13390 [Halogranum salarium B-1]|uniref:Uncharacterized protein n=1 Tax=Halogranum salarium B-1 TaxID=1210908 RepID=J3JH73_9EURY|nr:hypothetical protein HSB1_13390 [Halogranum salarium B-1]
MLFSARRVAGDTVTVRAENPLSSRSLLGRSGLLAASLGTMAD